MKLQVFTGRDGNFKVHKYGCQDVTRWNNRHLGEPAWTEDFNSMEQAVRELWADQIGDNWDYDKDGDPSLAYLAAHMFVGSIDFLPCCSKQLKPLPPESEWGNEDGTMPVDEFKLSIPSRFKGDKTGFISIHSMECIDCGETSEVYQGSEEPIYKWETDHYDTTGHTNYYHFKLERSKGRIIHPAKGHW